MAVAEMAQRCCKGDVGLAQRGAMLPADRCPKILALAARCEALPAFQAAPFEAGG